MPRIKTKSVVTAFILCLIFTAAALVFLIPSRIQPESIQQAFIPSIEEKLGGNLSFRGFHLKTFPRITVELQAPEFRFLDGSRRSFRAERAVLHLSFLHALLGKTRPARAEIYGGETSYTMSDSFPLKNVELKKIDLKLYSLQSKGPIKFEVSAGLFESPKVLKGRGWISRNPANQDFTVASLNAELSVEQIDLSRLEAYYRSEFPVRFDQGKVDGTLTLQKEAQDPWIHLDMNLHGDKVIYRMPDVSKTLASPEFSTDFEFRLKRNQETNEVVLERGVVVSPVASFTANGRFLTETGEIQSMRMTASQMIMEMIPHYFIPLNTAVPFNTGFSGLSDLEMSLEGTLEHLTIHANWDLTPTLLTYGRFFSKPKDLPLAVSSDLLLKKGNILSGDFSLRLKKANIKGALTDVDLRTSSGQLNVITNKFDIQDWESLIPPLADYDLGGELKILINFDGNLEKLEETKRGFNLTLEKGWLSRKDDVGIQNADVSMDFSDVSFKIKEARFDFGDSEIQGKATIFNFPQNPNATFELSSEQFKMDKAFHTFLVLSEGWFPPEEVERFRSLRDGIMHYLPVSEPIGKLQMTGKVKDRRWTFSQVRFEAFGGTIRSEASVEMASSLPLYWADVEINRLSLARYTALAGREEKIMDGNLFLKTKISGHHDLTRPVEERFTGHGEVKITNGEFHSFDLMAKIAESRELTDLGILSTGTTPFDDLNFIFEARGGKFETSNLVMMSPDLWIEGRGDLVSENGLNLRLEGFLSHSLTKQVLEPLIGRQHWAGEERLGPIPILMTGPMSAPILRLDSGQLALLFQELREQKSHRVLRNFLPEDLLFEDRSRS